MPFRSSEAAACTNTNYKPIWYIHTLTFTTFSPGDLQPTTCLQIALSGLTYLDTMFFTRLYYGGNGAGSIPDAPSTMLDIVRGTNT